MFQSPLNWLPFTPHDLHLRIILGVIVEKPFGRDLKSVPGPRGRNVKTEAFGMDINFE